MNHSWKEYMIRYPINYPHEYLQKTEKKKIDLNVLIMD